MGRDGSTVRPLLRSAQNRDPVAGSARDDGRLAAQGMDLTYVGGYSDKRAQMERDMAAGREPTTGLSHRFHYVTVQKPNGRQDLQALTRFTAMGYRRVKADEVENLGLDGIPVAAFVTPDGYLQVGDAQLMVCDAATAERNYNLGRSAVEEQSTDDFTTSELRRAGQEVGGGRGDIVTSSLEQETKVTKS